MSVRLSLALLVGIPAALAYPWDSAADRWLLGIAVGIVVIVLAWWRGHFVTTLIARRVAMASGVQIEHKKGEVNELKASLRNPSLDRVRRRAHAPRAALPPAHARAAILPRRTRRRSARW